MQKLYNILHTLKGHYTAKLYKSTNTRQVKDKRKKLLVVVLKTTITTYFIKFIFFCVV